MNLIALPALTDNYIWLLHDGIQAIVVDPGEAGPVIRVLRELELKLVGILVTHHHHDHIDGIQELRCLLEGPVYGPEKERIPQPFSPVFDGQNITVARWNFEVLCTPGHTAGHVAYFMQPINEKPVVFCGDTLFSAGCGRLAEGQPHEMLSSLQRLAALPPQTLVCCTHEYTLSNLQFARLVEPHNQTTLMHEAWCLAQRQANQPTLPSTIELEQKINPFLRCSQAQVRQSAQSHSSLQSAEIPYGELAVFTVLRQWKNALRA